MRSSIEVYIERDSNSISFRGKGKVIDTSVRRYSVYSVDFCFVLQYALSAYFLSFCFYLILAAGKPRAAGTQNVAASGLQGLGIPANNENLCNLTITLAINPLSVVHSILEPFPRFPTSITSSHLIMGLLPGPNACYVSLCSYPPLFLSFLGKQIRNKQTILRTKRMLIYQYLGRRLSIGELDLVT